MPAPRRPAPPPASRPAPRPTPAPAQPARAPAPRPAPPRPQPRPEAPKPATRAPAQPQAPKRAAPNPVDAARRSPGAGAKRQGTKPPTQRLPARTPAKPPARATQARKPARPQAQRKRPKPAAHQARPAPAGGAPAGNVEWWNVTASNETYSAPGVLARGGPGACRTIQDSGYSELSSTPGGPLDFAALGNLPCLTPMIIMNPANGRTTTAVKQDKGGGSSFLPVMGLYPQTLREIGLDPGAGEFHVRIRRVDGRPLRPVRGTRVVGGSAGSTPVVPVVKPRKLYFNPLEHANVTPERIDDGVDYAGTGYYVAIADCKVTAAVKDGSGWEKEGYVEYQIITDGPLKGVYVYYAEGVVPSVAVGEFVRGGEKICGLRVPMPFGTEIGFAAGTQELSWATKYGGGHHSKWEVGGVTNVATAAGVAFSRLIQRLGGPPGIIEGPIRGTYPPWAPGGQIPSGVTPAPTTPTGSAIAGSPTNAQQLASGYKWPNDLWSAFWELHNGMGEASHHSHAAWEYARAIKYRTTKP